MRSSGARRDGGPCPNRRPAHDARCRGRKHRLRHDCVRQFVLRGDAHPAARAARGDVPDLQLLPQGRRHRRFRRPAARAAGRAAAVARRYRCAVPGPSAAAVARLRRLGQEIRRCSAPISSPSSTAWKWTCRRISARPILPPSTSIAIASQAPSGDCRCGCSVLPTDDGILLAHHLGRALQLTNILRDIDEDAAIGRLYLPREGLQDAGIAGTDPLKVAADPHLPKVCAPLVARARTHFESADEVMARHPRRAGARATDHVEILSGDPGIAGCAGLRRAAGAGPYQQACPACHRSALRLHLMQKTVHIIGAGISGLAAAVRLANAGYRVCLHEATQQAGGRCRSYFDAATNLTIDNGNHLLLSGNRHAVAYARSIGTEAGLVGPKQAQFPFVDLSTGQRWLLDLGDGRLPLWVLDEGRRVPDTSLRDYLALMPLIWARKRKLVGDVDPLRRHALRSAGAAAVAGGAECRSARRVGGARRRRGAGNSVGGRAGLPAADRARRLERRPGRSRDQAARRPRAPASRSATSCANWR